MKKWLKSLTKQGKMMIALVLVLLIGIILRWDNVKQKAGIWFRVNEIIEEQQKDTVPSEEVLTIENQTITDSLQTDTIQPPAASTDNEM